MTNLNYIKEVGKMLLEWKISLYKLISSVVKKGLTRMYQINIKDLLSKTLLSQILDANLDEKSYNLIMGLLKSFKEQIELLVQNIVNTCKEDFEKENPDLKKRDVREQVTYSPFGPIKTKHQRYRDGEFTNPVIKKQSKSFFINTIMLALLIANGVDNFEILISLFHSLNVPMYNDEVSRIKKLIQNYIQEQSKEEIKKPHDSHQLVVFCDAVHVRHKEKCEKFNPLTKEYELKDVSVRKVVINAIGIDSKGVKRPLASVIAPYENTIGYHMLFRKLYEEKGIKQIDLVVTDGTKAINDALLTYYPTAAKQRCAVHVIRDIRKMVAKKNRRPLTRYLLKIYKFNSKVEASKFILKSLPWLNKNFPAVGKKIEKIANSLIAVYDLPKSLWRAAYTNNVSENYNSVFRRLSPSSTCFNSIESIEWTSQITSYLLGKKYKKYDLN